MELGGLGVSFNLNQVLIVHESLVEIRTDFDLDSMVFFIRLEEKYHTQTHSQSTSDSKVIFPDPLHIF